MIKIDSIKLSIKENKSIENYLLDNYSLKDCSFKILKKSIDAREHDNILYIYSICLDLDSKTEEKLVKKYKNISFYEEKEYSIPKASDKNKKVVIVGMGPAGLFASLILLEAGFKPIIIERGKDVDERYKDVLTYWNEGKLNPSSNVQFGEGGAGTFSDGKLNTGIKDKEGRKDFVLNTFVKCGANEDILYDSKPHIGSDVLRIVIKNMRLDLISKGAEIRFSTTFVGFESDDSIKNVKVINENGLEETIKCDNLILAIGHSSRDTFRYLKNRLNMEPKPFAVGFRVIHEQSIVDESLYGKGFLDLYEDLPPSSYKLTYTDKSGRGVYSFCMCPGGYVVNASSERGRTVVNGMSDNKRDSGYANSAVIVQVSPKDFGEKIESGIEFQEAIEEKVFEKCNGKIPVSSFIGFEKGDNDKSESINPDKAIKGLWEYSDLRDIYPDYINQSFIEGIKDFDKKIKGFASSNPLLCASETRSSSPVRILRDESFEANIKGIYPCGEGAGYAGGIVSAAIDGMKTAEAVIMNK